MSLIFNADDLGLAPSVNRSIIAAFQKGLLKSASLMVNMPFAQEALSELQLNRNKIPGQCPGLGLHFCLTSGKSILSPNEIPLLVDEKGFFRNGFASLLYLLYSSQKQEALRQVEKEFQAQFEQAHQWIQQYGFTDDHLDSHQHIHTMPGLWTILATTAAKYNLVLRRPHEFYGSISRFGRSLLKRFPSGIAKKYILDILLTRSKSLLDKELIHCGYFGILDTGHLDESSLLNILSVFPVSTSLPKAFEINLHPWNMTEDDISLLSCSEADRQFATSLWRRKEWNVMNQPDSILKLLKIKKQETITFQHVSQIAIKG